MTSTSALDGAPGRPYHQQIAEMLRADIISKRLPPGVGLPPERRLRERFGVSRGTIRAALSLLRAEGLIDVTPGSGAYVRDTPPVRRVIGPERYLRRKRHIEGLGPFGAEMAQLGRQEAIRVEVSRAPVPGDIADRLGLEEGTLVVRRHRRMAADDTPLVMSTSYIPLELASGTPIENEDTGPGGTYARLEEMGHLITSYQEEVFTRMPSPTERAELAIPDGVPVFRVIRCARGYDGTVFEVNDQIMPGDRYTILYTFDAE